MIPFRTHVAYLAAQHHIIVDKRTHGVAAMAHIDRRVIEINQLAGPVEYYTALHELGHIVLDHGRNAPKGSTKMLLQEGEAWEWAIDNAKITPTPAVKAWMSDCLNTYIAITDNLPRPEHPFWRLVRIADTVVEVAGPKGRLP